MRELLINEIISKGGLYGYAAGFYSGDEAMADKLIVECYEQCHNRGAVEMWGSELVLGIIRYRLDLIRIPLREVNRELEGHSRRYCASRLN